MKHFFRGSLCLALALVLMVSAAFSCFAETCSNIADCKKEQSQIEFCEYDYIVELREKTDSELTAMGLSTDRIEEIRSDHAEKELLARKELSDDVLMDCYGYTKEEIEILRKYDGGKMEDHPELRAVSAKVTFNNPTVMNATASQVKIKFTWSWNKMPTETSYKDAIAFGWSPTFGSKNGKLRLNKNQSIHLISYVGVSDSAHLRHDYSDFEDVTLNSSIKTQFVLQRKIDGVKEWAKTGQFILTFDRTSGSANLTEVDFTFAYGHSVTEVQSVSVGVSTDGNGSVSVSFGKGTNKVGSKTGYVTISTKKWTNN